MFCHSSHLCMFIFLQSYTHKTVEDLNLMRMENIIKEIEREGENGG